MALSRFKIARPTSVLPKELKGHAAAAAAVPERAQVFRYCGLQPADGVLREGSGDQEGARLQRGRRQGLAQGIDGDLRQIHLREGAGGRRGIARRRWVPGLPGWATN